MYIKKIEIENVRNIANLKLSFPSPAGWHVLIGDNGAGKSTILRTIALALIGPHDAPALRLDFNAFVKLGETEGFVELQIEKHSFDGYSGQGGPIRRPFLAGLKLSKLSTSKPVGSCTPLKKYQYANNYIWSRKPGWFSTSFGPFRRFTGGNKEWDKVYYSNPRAASHLSVFGEDVALTESLEWLVGLNYQKLEENASSAQLLEDLTKFINSGNLLPHGAKISGVSSKGVKIVDGNNCEVYVTEMSDGFRSILSLTFELLRQMVNTYGAEKVFKHVRNGEILVDLPGVVIIDEIDVHLHPTWQTRIGEWFTTYFPRLQFIVTTHSPLVCRAAEQGSIWRLAGPDSKFESYQVKDIELKRLIYGNVLEAMGTEAFGQQVARSAKSQEMLEKLAEMETRFTFGKLNKKEEKEMFELRKIFTTDDTINL